MKRHLIDIDITKPRGEILTTRLCVERARSCNRNIVRDSRFSRVSRLWRDAWMRAARELRSIGGEL